MDFRKRFLSGLLAVCFAFALAACGVSGVNHDLEDGTYLVEILLEGGSGRSHIQSPAELTVQDGTMSVTLVWSSANYDYMVVDGKTFFPVTLTPGSTFCIPVEKLGERFSVSADTTAMSTPHEIEYTLTVFAPGESAGEVEPTESTAASAPAVEGAVSQMLIYDHSMELHSAQGFSVDYYKDGYALLTIKQDSSRFLLIPQGKETPADLAEDVTPLRLPLQNVYLAASAVMDMFISLDALDTLAFSGTKEEGWYLPEAREAMAQGRIRYAGSYSAPDYEQIRAAGCALAIESTMIYHTPEVKEQLERFGIPVLVDRSSYESSPLGRVEWVKVYGLLTGKNAEAEAAFSEQQRIFDDIAQAEKNGKTVAFFYISSSGAVNVRRTSDYIPGMIEMAGGVYLPRDTGGDGASGSATFSMQMESFYAEARDADFLIYNSTIEGQLYSLDDLISKDSLLANFKAVKDGNVFCTTQNIYQSSMELGLLASDFSRILSGSRDGLNYLYPLE